MSKHRERGISVTPGRDFAYAMGVILHESTHVMIDRLKGKSWFDERFQAAEVAYSGKRLYDRDNNELVGVVDDPDQYVDEALAGYVDERVKRWTETYLELSALAANNSLTQTKVRELAGRYNEDVAVQGYQTVHGPDGTVRQASARERMTNDMVNLAEDFLLEGRLGRSFEADSTFSAIVKASCSNCTAR